MLDDWARRWDIPAEALDDLRESLVVVSTESTDATSESGVQQRVRLDYARNSHALWRNNVGAGQLMDGERFIRFGLANESKQMNQRIKSGDLIGITRVLITPAHVGQVLGVFTSVETKRPGWVYNENDPHSAAQARWILLVRSLGGIAHFTT